MHAPGEWSILSSHGLVLVAIAEDPTIRLTDIASRTELTQRAVQNIIADLEHGGLLTHVRIGRRNVYRIDEGAVVDGKSVRLRVGDLLSAFSLDHAQVAAQPETPDQSRRTGTTR